MPSCTRIRQLLPRLRLLGRNVSLQPAASGKPATNASKELKRLLYKALEENALADETLVQAADCLYELKGCNTTAGAHICKAVEQRPHIYTRPLSGGVLWSFHAAGGRSTKRKRVVKSSCVAAIEAFMNELFAIQNDSRNASHLTSTLSNLAIVGQCFSLPVSTRARLEQAILDARDSLVPILERSNAVVAYIEVLYRFRIRSDPIAEDALNAFVAVASYHEIISTSALAKTIKILQAWRIGPLGANRSALDMLTHKLNKVPVLLGKNPNALVKLYLASTRVAPATCDIRESDRVPSDNGGASNDNESEATICVQNATESDNHTGLNGSALSGAVKGAPTDECHKDLETEQTAADKLHTSQYNHSTTNQSSVENAISTDGRPTQSASFDAVATSGVQCLSALLLRHCCNLVTRCNARLLVVLYNAMCHHILRDVPIMKYDAGHPSTADERSVSDKGANSAANAPSKHRADSIMSTGSHLLMDIVTGFSLSDFATCVHTISVEVRDALALDASAKHGAGQPPLTLYDEKDLTTIRRAALVASRICSGAPDEVARLAEELLRDRFGVAFVSELRDKHRI
ncbi:hypothetical protein, conserved [Babesia bigemina]|uniref:Uncharacterized protein n=1 Tax=Babesia bigemina TaxID=5866 RepID=A0A061D0U0_BABBI|nr:hypothetical protein, conserved [Babesia bigemina]CDR93747.1 hypothetical protein, conserved [Babesia bigemina]|eukprot:XP_012765933.1 hypothetical protein, conserved [Babesia bigemina]